MHDGSRGGGARRGAAFGVFRTRGVGGSLALMVVVLDALRLAAAVVSHGAGHIAQRVRALKAPIGNAPIPTAIVHGLGTGQVGVAALNLVIGHAFLVATAIVRIGASGQWVEALGVAVGHANQLHSAVMPNLARASRVGGALELAFGDAESFNTAVVEGSTGDICVRFRTLDVVVFDANAVHTAVGLRGAGDIELLWALSVAIGYANASSAAERAVLADHVWVQRALNFPWFYALVQQTAGGVGRTDCGGVQTLGGAVKFHAHIIPSTEGALWAGLCGVGAVFGVGHTGVVFPAECTARAHNQRVVTLHRVAWDAPVSSTAPRPIQTNNVGILALYTAARDTRVISSTGRGVGTAESGVVALNVAIRHAGLVSAAVAHVAEAGNERVVALDGASRHASVISAAIGDICGAED